jgi:metal-sulfur cluster biosynthetic enzyme
MSTNPGNYNDQSQKVTAALREVLDPEIGLNIVDLGLVYQIDFNEAEREVNVTMTLTTQFCPMGESIRDSAEQALRAAFPTYAASIHLVFDPPWSSARISEEGLAYLNR